MMNKLLLFIVYILFFVKLQAQKNNAASLITEAKEAVQKTDKKILVKFSASWCGWCHKMEAALLDSTVLPIFNKYYVKVTMIVLESAAKKTMETVGGEAYYRKYGGTQKGLPYWLIIDGQEKLLANSNYKKEGEDLTKDGDNVGCPAEETEIEYFLRTLTKTSKITKEELLIIKTRFSKIKIDN